MFLKKTKMKKNNANSFILIKKNIKKKVNNCKMLLDKKSYYKRNIKYNYKRFFFNKFFKKIIRRNTLNIQIKIIKQIKKSKERKKRLVLLFFFHEIMELWTKNIILMRLSFYGKIKKKSLY